MSSGYIAKDAHSSHTKSCISVPWSEKDAKRKTARIHGKCRFRELDSLRGLCTCVVVFGHMWFAFGVDVPIPHLIDYSGLSVKVFFALSGHLVAYQYLQDGKFESLLSAVFRRLPRLLFPAFCANLLCWMLSAIGAYAAESSWRKLISNGTFCEGCMPDDLSVVVASSIRVVWSFGRDHFVWLWTVSHEIYGSIVVFMLAPIFRWIVDSQLWGFDDSIRIGSLVMPRRLHRCIVTYAVFLASSAVVYMAFASWISSDNADLAIEKKWSVQASSIAQTSFLFIAGLAIAHIGSVFGDVEDRIFWAKLPLNTQSTILSWIPIGLIVGGAASPWIVSYVATYWYWSTGHWLFPCGAIAILAGVVTSPLKVHIAITRFSLLGQMSYSLYLLHMGVIYAVGMPLYVWLHPILAFSHSLTFALVVTLCAGPMYLSAFCFWRYVEDPVGVRFPILAFNALWRQRDALTTFVIGKWSLLTDSVKFLQFD